MITVCDPSVYTGMQVSEYRGITALQERMSEKKRPENLTEYYNQFTLYAPDRRECVAFVRPSARVSVCPSRT